MGNALAAVALLLTPLGTPSGGFHWQRIITPPAGAGLREACVVLDATTFANAAPALRDLRLFQDGTELPYVIEESYDERALNSGITPEDDRSEYEPVYVGTMQPRPPSGVAGQFEDAERLSREGHFGYYASTIVDAHVPVERVRLDPVPTQTIRLGIEASMFAATGTYSFETEGHTIDADHPAWPFTLGANLQREARVTVVDDTPGPRTERVIFEMRKRSLCYQPRSAGPLMLYLGGGEGMAAKSYALANGFSTALERPYATMGPLEPNPDQQTAQKHLISRLLLAIGILTATLLLTVFVATTVLRKQKNRLAAVPSALP